MPTFDVRLHMTIKARDRKQAHVYATRLASLLCDATEIMEQTGVLLTCCPDNLDEVRRAS